VDNIVFQNFSHGIHAYAETGGYLNNLHVEGNIAFSNGEPAGALARNILVGGSGVVALSPVVRNNYTYYPLTSSQGENNLGFATGCQNLTLQDNRFAGGDRALVLRQCIPSRAAGNIMYGRTAGVTTAMGQVLPAGSGVNVFVRPNKYEPGRANIIVYNWARKDVVEVTIGSILSTGTAYEVRNAQDYFGPPVVTGKYDGRALRIPMTNLRVSKPLGASRTLKTTGPTFGAFILLGRVPAPVVQTRSPARLAPAAK
jgi:hypothetical protein